MVANHRMYASDNFYNPYGNQRYRARPIDDRRLERDRWRTVAHCDWILDPVCCSSVCSKREMGERKREIIFNEMRRHNNDHLEIYEIASILCWLKKDTYINGKRTIHNWNERHEIKIILGAGTSFIFICVMLSHYCHLYINWVSELWPNIMIMRKK